MSAEDRSKTAPLGGWLRRSADASLSDVFRSVRVDQPGGFWRKFISFAGPGFLVAVGYMDPGNWATSIAGGAQFGYTLLFVVMLSNIMAIILQSLSARLGIGAGRDLAQACHDAFSKPVSLLLWGLAETAIIATDVAEVVGTAIGFNLLFGLPLQIGILITALDVFLILALQRLGFRYVEAFIMALLGIIFFCFFFQMVLARPDWGGVVLGFLPSRNIISNPTALYLALGIIGATVMPHNLYLHSGIVQTRAFGHSVEARKQALRFATWDSTSALMLALLINASILILAAATFHARGLLITELKDAHEALGQLLGSMMVPWLFGIALLACGLNSSVTATMAGQIVMEGFINLRVAPWMRRLITRMVAIIPALAVTMYYGDQGSGALLVFSQVILALQLPFAVIPLVLFTSQKAKLGALTAPLWLTVTAWAIAGLLIVLNLKLMWDVVKGWLL